MMNTRQTLRDVREALASRDWTENFPIAAKIIGPQTHRAWIAAAFGTTVFTAFFWLFALMGQGRLGAEDGVDARGFATAVAVLYFLVTVLASPLFAHVGGTWLDRWAGERFSQQDSVLIFAGLGAVAGLVPMTALVVASPGLTGLGPAFWLFWLPTMVGMTVTRAYLDRVVKSVTAERIVFAIASIPPIVVILLLLGLYVAQGAEV